MVETYNKGITLPLMRPIPLPIPQPAKWWNVWGKIKNLGVRMQPRKWLIEEDYLIDVPWFDITICIPKGFIFDGASVPRIFWPLMSPTGIMFIAGLYHDFGYRYNCWLDINYTPIFVDRGKVFFDGQIEKMGTWINDSIITPNVCWAGLVIGGWMTWYTRRKENKQASVDFPQILITE